MMKKKEGKKEKQKKKTFYIYLTLKSGKKTISHKAIDAGQFSFFVSCTVLGKAWSLLLKINLKKLCDAAF